MLVSVCVLLILISPLSGKFLTKIYVTNDSRLLYLNLHEVLNDERTISTTKVIAESDIAWLDSREVEAFRDCYNNHSSSTVCNTIRPDQSLNFLPDGALFSRKTYFTYLLHDQPDGEFNYELFYPKTHRLHLKSDRESFVSKIRESYGYDSLSDNLQCCHDCYESEKSKNQTCPLEPDIWIMKPGISGRGMGIFIIDPIYMDECIEELEDRFTIDTTVRSGMYIAQRYLKNPFLYKKKKNSLRVYFLVVSVNPLLVLAYDEFRVLVARDDYTKKYYDSLTTHLTNEFQQHKKYGNYSTDQQRALILDMNTFSEYVVEKKRIRRNSNWIETFLSDSFSIVSYITKLFRNKVNQVRKKTESEEMMYVLKNKKKFPHFFGFYCMDLMLDEDLKLWLHEVNWKCSLELDVDVKRKMYVPLVKEIIQIVDEVRRKRNEGKLVELTQLSSLKKFRWVVRGDDDLFPGLYQEKT